MIRVYRDKQDAVGGLQRRAENQIKRTIKNAYRTAYREVRGRIADLWEAAGGELTPGEARRYGRLRRLNEWIEEHYGAILRDVDRKTKIAVSEQYQEEIYRRYWQIEQAVGIEFPWGQVPRRAVERAINNPLSKLKESSLLGTDRRRRIYRVRQAITQSILQGKTLFQTSRTVASALDTGLYESLRVLRTEMGRVWGQAQVDAMKEAKAEGVDTRLKLLATLDDRTRPQSANMDGDLSDEEGRFQYPDGNWYIKGQTGNPAWDINDRETTVPYIDDLEGDVRRARDLADARGELVPNTPFRQWAEERELTVNRYGQTLFDEAAAI